ncbi:MAG: signal peptidase II [Gemmataceae bacterium]
MTPKSYRGQLWIIAIVGFALDQITKYGMFRWLYDPSHEGRREVIDGWFRFIAQYTEDVPQTALQAWNGPVLPRVNHGALFGVGGEYQVYANSFFACVSIGAAIAIAVWSLRQATTRDRLLCSALGLILAGTLGNLFDRVVFHGVRDFLYFYWFEWPVFNVADCFLVCGAGLLLLQAFLTPVDEKKPTSEPQSLVAAAAE